VTRVIIFSTATRLEMGPTHPHVQWVWEAFFTMSDDEVKNV